MATYTAEAYRRPLFDPGDALFRRCLAASGAVAAVLVACALLAPVREHVISRVEELPPRFAKLILEPKPVALKPLPAGDRVSKPSGGGGGGGGGGNGGATAKLELPAPVARPSVTGGRAASAPALSSGAGEAGRARARSEVGATLANSTASLSNALAGLSSSLGAAPASAPARPGGGRARVVRAARGDRDLSGISTGLSGSAGADLGGSAVEGSLVAIGDLSALRGGSGGGPSSGSGGGSGGGAGGGLGSGFGTGVGPGSGSGSGGGSGSGYGTGTGSGIGEGSGGGQGGGAYQGGSGPGVYRSNASLLAVIQKYAAGIQYCYGNELKRDSSLRGKLVVALTVSAAGDVLEATVVQNTVGSSRLAQCALSQIREWKFPPIREGVTTFQAPFVFTPPN